MKEAMIGRWCQAPWHAWLKEDDFWKEIFAELWVLIPDKYIYRLLYGARALIALPSRHCSFILRISHPLPYGAFLLQLHTSLETRPKGEALAILAHELAHLCVDLTEDCLENDLRADALVVEWGLKSELLQALVSDLEPNHQRIKAIQS